MLSGDRFKQNFEDYVSELLDIIILVQIKVASISLRTFFVLFAHFGIFISVDANETMSTNLSFS